MEQGNGTLLRGVKVGRNNAMELDCASFRRVPYRFFFSGGFGPCRGGSAAM